MAKKPLPLDRQLIYSMYRANIALTRLCKPALDDLDLTLTQYLVLSALWEIDNQSVGVLADRLDLEPSTLTPLLKGLETAEFIVRRRDQTNERRVEVSLTDKGKALRSRADEIEEKLLKATGLKPEAMHALNDQLRALRDSLSGVKT